MKLDLTEFRKWADDLFNRMQTPEAHEATERALAATPEELGQAALEAHQKAANTTENASQTDLVGEQDNDGRVGANR